MFKDCLKQHFFELHLFLYLCKLFEFLNYNYQLYLHI